jgi:hypothetical protein
MAKIVFLIVFALPFFSWTEDSKKTPQLESYQIIAPDDQNFAMNEYMYDGHILNNLEFFIGERQQAKRTVPLKIWNQWRQKWTYLYQNLKETPGCLHPLALVKKVGEKKKFKKSICLAKLTTSDRRLIKELTTHFEKYLYDQ